PSRRHCATPVRSSPTCLGSFCGRKHRLDKHGLNRSRRVLEARGRVGPAPLRAPSGRFDLDASPLRTRRLGDANREHTVVELRVDAFRVDFAWEHYPELELADPARTPADDAFALALLDLAADRQLVAANLDVHVLAVDPGHLGLDDVGVLE